MRFEKFKETVGAVEFEMRNAFEILHAFSAFDEFRIRSAATVADAEEGEKVEDAVAFAAVVLRADHSLGLKHGAVGVFGREMGEHGGAVDSMPEEALVRETVELVPCDFCGEEAVASGFPENLRERGGVAEGVGQPEIADVDAEFIAEEILAVEELAHDGFSAGEHAVRFDPHSALDFPASGGDGLADFFVETGVVFLDERIVLSRGGSENVFRIFVDQHELRTEGACAFADGFAYGPEPAGVNVRMSDSVCGHDRAGGTEIEKLFENSACGTGVCGILVPDVGGAPEDSEKAPDAPVSFGQSFKERQKNLEIELEVPRFTVEDCEIARAEQAGESVPRMFGFAEETERIDESEEIICRAFDPEFEFVAGLLRAVDAESGFAVIGAEDASSGEPADGDSVVSENHGFSARVEDEREFETFEFLRNGSRDMKPCAGAVLSPPSARFESGILKSEPFFKRHGPFGWREHAIETERV